MPNAYSFQDVSATFSGPTGTVNLAYGAAPAKEGLTISPSGDQASMKVGADGTAMHTLHADRSGKVVARYLKVSPTNALLMAQFDAQRLSAGLTGQNIITVREIMSGDLTTCVNVAFAKKPDLVYDDDGPMMEWTFNCGHIDSILGAY